MSRLTRESNINLGNKEHKVEELLKTIIYLPAKQVGAFFQEIGLTIPREIRMFVLREVLRDRVILTRKSRLTLADELNYRLSWFTEFTETQLENLLVFFDDRKLDKEFIEEFWTDLFSYMVEKGVPPKDIKRLIDMSLAHVKAVGLELPVVRTYNREIKNLFFDSYGRIDGLTQAKFRPVLFKSATLSEVRDLGSKYGVEVPRRLKKSELADIIIKELTDRKQHTNILEQEIRGMSVLVMQRFAIDHDIKASTELKKEEIIEYILANAKETKEAYFVPDSKEVYEKEVSEVAEQPIEDIEPEAPKEEQQPLDEIQEVTEVPSADDFIEQTETRVEDEKKVQYVQSNVDFSELISEVKRLREVVEDFINPNQAELKTEENVTDEEIDEARIIAEDTKPAVRDKVLLNVLNTAEFFGTTKDLKKAMRKEEVAEREAFVEDSKKHSGIGTGIEARINMAPAEARFFGRLFLNLGKALLKLLLKLLKLALILFIVALVIFILYAVITKLVEIPFLVDFNDTLNGLLIAGKGILDHFHDFLGALGL